MSDTTPATDTDPASLKTEAKELEADIKEAEKEADKARDAGNDARADRLEASITDTKKELADIKATLKQLIERPFAPAPGDGEKTDPPAAAAAGDGKKEEGQAAEEPPAGDGKPKKRHFLFGERWNEGNEA